MKVLIVCSGNAHNFNFSIHQSFIYEQIETVKSIYHIQYDTFFIKGKGLLGYLRNMSELNYIVSRNDYSLIHAHNLTSGLLSRLQLKVPLVVTFHGSDVNIALQRKFSKLLSYLTKHNIVVSDSLFSLLNSTRNISVIPCGIDKKIFYPINKTVARNKLGLMSDKYIILFASAFDNKVKNFSLAKEAIDNLANEGIGIIELKNRTREDVNLLMNAANLLLLTSISEGSPQVVKEAMACNCPIVATDVGDIREVIGDTKNCFVTGFDASEIALRINQVLESGKRTNGSEKIKLFDNNLIALRIMDVYDSVVEKNNR